MAPTAALKSQPVTTNNVGNFKGLVALVTIGFIAYRLLPPSWRQGAGLLFISLSPLLRCLFLSLCNEDVCGPARPGNESCYLDRHTALGVTSADLSMTGVRRLDNRGIEVIRSEVWFRSFALFWHAFINYCMQDLTQLLVLVKENVHTIDSICMPFT